MDYEMKEMVHVEDEKIQLMIFDKTESPKTCKWGFKFRPQYKIKDLFEDVVRTFSLENKNFDLILRSTCGQYTVLLNDKLNLTLNDLPGIDRQHKNIITIMSNDSFEIESKQLSIEAPPDAITETKMSTEYDYHVTDSTANDFTNEKYNTDGMLNLLYVPTTPQESSDDDLALGASASPTEIEFKDFNGTSVNSDNGVHGGVIRKYGSSGCFSPPPAPISSSTTTQCITAVTTKPNSGYVGLVNQAMTCYLNSLLQALFMTPEFRNSIYKMKFDENDKSIPFQLQKLFVNLQTSNKMAVETTDLTKSFGWDSAQTWTQHDIQELCRVMFDALEQEFKRTKQENWINKFYEGKMLDYVKCLECGIEKSREDKFLDIPLPLRPFGSTKAYESIEEALRAFVQPETLNENNQYFCEKCNKKCDAHKGLKFTEFPYILTLHLKRFDFDYQTLHRIKLNDKVTFPQTLNLNCFLNATDVETFTNLRNNNQNVVGTQLNCFVNSIPNDNENHENGTKYDDCSTTDSGAALEEDNCSGFGTTASSSHHESELQEDDEGIEISTATDRSQISHTSGPYIYELFAVMVHSGSASGGHYYAYIKDFETGKWFCFNDQTVSSITHEDIQKTFGGDTFRPYYSGIYSSSTNAYMLMYRRIDPQYNEKAITVDEFSENILKMQRYITEIEEEEKKRRPTHEILKPKVFFYNPKLKRFKDTKVYVTALSSSILENILEQAYGSLKIQQFAPIKRCRLVAYNDYAQQIERSIDNDNLLNVIYDAQLPDFLLEIREENQQFEKYECKESVTFKAFEYKIENNQICLNGPFLIWVAENDIYNEIALKKAILRTYGAINDKSIDLNSILVATTYYGFKKRSVKRPPNRILFTCLESINCNEQQKQNATELLNKFAKEHLSEITYAYISVPPNDEKSLQSLCIPIYNPNDDSDDDDDDNNIKECINQNSITPKQSPSSKIHNDVEFFDDVLGVSTSYTFKPNEVVERHTYNANSNSWKNNSTQASTSTINTNTTTTSATITTNTIDHESGEDSSLSDGDRTLVDETNPPANDLSNESSPSHSPQLSSSPENYKLSLRLTHDDTKIVNQSKENLYFYAVQLENDPDCRRSCYNTTTNNNKCYLIYVDVNMTVQNFKKKLQKIINVPAKHFKLSSGYQSESKCSFLEGENIPLIFERHLQNDEIKVKLFYFKLNQLNDFSGKLQSICQYYIQLNKSITDIKCDLVEHLKKLDSDTYKTLTLENCRLWRKWGNIMILILHDEESLCKLTEMKCNELVIQECDENANMNTNENTLTLFAREWDPINLKLGNFKEITIDKKTDIRKALASISDISEEDIVYHIVPGESASSLPSFPYNELSKIDILYYKYGTEPIDFSKCENGYLCIFKNKQINEQSLTEKEQWEIKYQERQRINTSRGGTSTTYSPREERALKIYVDSKSSNND